MLTANNLECLFESTEKFRARVTGRALGGTIRKSAARLREALEMMEDRSD